MTAIEAGDTQSVDVRLPIRGDQPWARRPTSTLFSVLVDDNREINDVNRANNGANVAQTDILPVDPAAFEADPTSAAAGGEVIVAGEGLGPEPGKVLVHLGGIEMEAEILGWYDLGVRLSMPKLPLAGATPAELIVVRGDGAAANPVTVTVTPPDLGQPAVVPGELLPRPGRSREQTIEPRPPVAVKAPLQTSEVSQTSEVFLHVSQARAAVPRHGTAEGGCATLLFRHDRLGGIDQAPADHADHVDGGEDEEVDLVAGHQAGGLLAAPSAVASATPNRLACRNARPVEHVAADQDRQRPAEVADHVHEAGDDRRVAPADVLAQWTRRTPWSCRPKNPAREITRKNQKAVVANGQSRKHTHAAAWPMMPNSRRPSLRLPVRRMNQSVRKPPSRHPIAPIQSGPPL